MQGREIKLTQVKSACINKTNLLGIPASVICSDFIILNMFSGFLAS